MISRLTRVVCEALLRCGYFERYFAVIWRRMFRLGPVLENWAHPIQGPS
jgi:hypothetical protein